MRKYVLGVGAAAAAAAAMALFGAGTAAAAPDVVGMTYADASEEIDSDGGSPVVAVRVGDKTEQDDCIVANVWDASFYRDLGDEYGGDDGEVMLALNCNGGHATATNPGASVASPAGRESKVAADEAAAAEQEELEAVSTPDE